MQNQIEELHVTHGLKKSIVHIDKMYVSDVPPDITTNFQDLNSLFSSLKKGDLTVIAGRTAIGKTTFALQMAVHIAQKTNLPTIIFSMELLQENLTKRLISQFSHIQHDLMHNGALKDEDWGKLNEGVTQLAELPLFIDDNRNLNVNEITTKLTILNQNLGEFGLIVIDNLQLIGSSEKYDTRSSELWEITRQLKILAQKFDVPIVVTSHLNRNIETRNIKRPILSDLHDAGAIEHIADLILFLHRDDIHHHEYDTSDGKLLECMISKYRHGKATRSMFFYWQPEFMKFI